MLEQINECETFTRECKICLNKLPLNKMKGKQCVPCADKKYRESHKEQIANYKSIYNWLNESKIKEDKSIYNKNNKDKINETRKEYYKNNKDKINEKRREYYEKNKETILKKRIEKLKQVTK
jgi:hypothetical protein